MERAQAAGDRLIGDHIPGEAGQLPPAGDLLRQLQHDPLGDIEAPVIQRAAVALDTGVAVPRVEQEDVPPGDGVLPVPAGQHPGPVLHKADHVVFVEMAREWLYDALETVGLYAELLVVDHRSHCFFHVAFLLGESYYTRRKGRRLVKYPHFSAWGHRKGDCQQRKFPWSSFIF